LAPADRDNLGWLNANAHARVFAILQQEHDMTPATLHAVDFPQPTTVGYAHDVSSVNPAIGPRQPESRQRPAKQRAPATISLDHADWNHIRGLSLAGIVGFVVDT
jgi:hypothetical protein